MPLSGRLSPAGAWGGCPGQAERALPRSSSWCFSPVQILRSMRPPRAPASGPSIRSQPFGRTCQSQLMTVPSPSAVKVSPPGSFHHRAGRARTEPVRPVELGQLNKHLPASLAHARTEPRAQPDRQRGEQLDAAHGRVERWLVTRVGGRVEYPLDRRCAPSRKSSRPEPIRSGVRGLPRPAGSAGTPRARARAVRAAVRAWLRGRPGWRRRRRRWRRARSARAGR